MDGNLAGVRAYNALILVLRVSRLATYTLIHAFLVKRSHTKVALVLKKAVKDVVILKDDIDIEGPQLDEIVKQWKAFDAKKDHSSNSE
jgi:hypothetical protein